MLKKFLLLIGLVLGLTACGNEEEPINEVTTLKLAMFQDNRQVREQVLLFNEAHTDYQIEIVEYKRSSNAQEDGVAKLQREIISGEGPDIIDFGTSFSTSDIVGEYTENLLPYLERESEIQFFDNILEAFYYEDNLYALPISFSLDGFAGDKDVLGQRTKWNIAEMIECYQKNADSRILYPGETKKAVLGNILYGCSDYYIDWEQGSCSFDEEEFRQVLEFANLFPATLNLDEGFSAKQMIEDGETLLYPVSISGIYDICKSEFLFDGNEVYIGYPIEDNVQSGTMAKICGSMMGISISSEHKDVAWEFIAGFLEVDYQMQIDWGLPINKTAFMSLLEENREPEYELNAEGEEVTVVKGQLLFDGEEPVNFYCISQAQGDKLLELIEGVELCNATNTQLHSILLEEVSAYFEGDKTVEETMEAMQSRATIFVSERVK